MNKFKEQANLLLQYRLITISINMQKQIFWFTLTLMVSSLQVNAQYAKKVSTFRKHFIGSTMFLLGNLSSVNSPDFVQLNYGYRITEKDVISLEHIPCWLSR